MGPVGRAGRPGRSRPRDDRRSPITISPDDPWLLIVIDYTLSVDTDQGRSRRRSMGKHDTPSKEGKWDRPIPPPTPPKEKDGGGGKHEKGDGK
jgi:hypothetical protein